MMIMIMMMMNNDECCMSASNSHDTFQTIMVVICIDYLEVFGAKRNCVRSTFSYHFRTRAVAWVCFLFGVKK